MRSKLHNLCLMSATALLGSGLTLMPFAQAAETGKHMVIDGHNDLPWQYRERFGNRLKPLDVSKRQDQMDPPLHTDLPRLREGGVGAQFWSVYIPIETYGGAPGDASLVLTQMDVVRRLVERYPADLALAMTAEDIRSAYADGKIGSLMGIEGGHAIENSLGTLRSLYAAGARYMTLTHSKGLAWADSATDAARHDGLTEFGESVVREMNYLGMLVDLSHVTEATMHDALDTATAPVIFSHSSARGVADHPRNVPDSVLKRLPKNGGVVMVTFVPGYISQDRRDWDLARTGEEASLKAMHPYDEEKRRDLLTNWESSNPKPEVTLAQVADHIDHIRKVAGIQHIGVGGDFDGISSVVTGLEDVSTYPALFEELKARGYSDADCEAIAGGNVLRALEASEAVAQLLQRKRLAQDPPEIDVSGA
ncbi:dipeptidase [Congregibacter sp.]|jgi:membrane dipeptidase|uniref:dipeptidase n=1 Tax=Congregibacter sp. TaxID=2744308 RepID=UPI0039E57BE2